MKHHLSAEMQCYSPAHVCMAEGLVDGSATLCDMAPGLLVSACDDR